MTNLKQNKISEAINLFNLGRTDEASILIEEILIENPNNIDAINLKGGIYLRKK